MFSKKFAIIALAATALGTVPAGARTLDLDYDNTFDGLYIGAGGGYSAQNNNRGSAVEFDTNNDGTYGQVVPGTGPGGNAFTQFCGGFSQGAFSDGCKGNKDRGEYFGKVGFDKRFGNFVVGLVLEAGQNKTQSRTTAFSQTAAGSRAYAFTREADWQGAARLRAGYTPNGGFLFYATGGGIYANMKHGFATTNTTATFTANDQSDAWGYQAGGGVEAMIAKNISVGVEYLYTDIDDDKFYVTAANAGGAAPFGTGTRMRPSDQSFNYHTVRGSVNFRF